MNEKIEKPVHGDLRSTSQETFLIVEFETLMHQRTALNVRAISELSIYYGSLTIAAVILGAYASTYEGDILWSRQFLGMALVLSGICWLVGCITWRRLASFRIQGAIYVRGMNRIRGHFMSASMGDEVKVILPIGDEYDAILARPKRDVRPPEISELPVPLNCRWRAAINWFQVLGWGAVPASFRWLWSSVERNMDRWEGFRHRRFPEFSGSTSTLVILTNAALFAGGALIAIWLLKMPDVSIQTQQGVIFNGTHLNIVSVNNAESGFSTLIWMLIFAGMWCFQVLYSFRARSAFFQFKRDAHFQRWPDTLTGI